MKRFLVVAFIGLLSFVSQAASPYEDLPEEDWQSIVCSVPDEHQQFLTTYATVAQELSAETGVPASVMLAQAWVESHWGKSSVAKRNQNLFGIKYFKGAPHIKGRPWVLPGKRYCKYDNFSVSFRHLTEYYQSFYGHLLGRPWEDFIAVGYNGTRHYWDVVHSTIGNWRLYRFDA